MNQKIKTIQDKTKLGMIVAIAITSIWCWGWAALAITLIIGLPIWAIFTQ